eukprot:8085119-Karenia_brevis.AAC.1
MCMNDIGHGSSGTGKRVCATAGPWPRAWGPNRTAHHHTGQDYLINMEEEQVEEIQMDLPPSPVVDQEE